MGWIAAGFLLLAQGAPAQSKIDEAIRKGVKYLKGQGSPAAYNSKDPWHVPNSDELILLTLVHADVPKSDPVVMKYLKKSLEGKLHKTYKVSLQAMALEEIERVKYQWRIAQCAQFLVDNQCTNGQWEYGSPTPATKRFPPEKVTKTDATSGSAMRRYGSEAPSGVKPKVVRKIPVRSSRSGRASGDNSNSQYAALGLRACHDSGILLPAKTIQRAIQWWAKTVVVEKGAGQIATGGYAAVPGGWGYRLAHNKEPYSGMTAGATGALVIYDYILGRDWKRNRLVLSGMAWMTKNFSVTANKGGSPHGASGPKAWLYYYLYALERLGVLYDTETFGAHDWYAEGAREILKAQKGDGSWDVSTAHAKHPVWDTCFAILFLKKATRPLVESVDANR